MGLQGVTGGYKRLHRVARGYKVTRVTRVNIGLQGVTGG